EPPDNGEEMGRLPRPEGRVTLPEVFHPALLKVSEAAAQRADGNGEDLIGNAPFHVGSSCCKNGGRQYYTEAACSSGVSSAKFKMGSSNAGILALTVTAETMERRNGNRIAAVFFLKMDSFKSGSRGASFVS